MRHVFLVLLFILAVVLIIALAGCGDYVKVIGPAELNVGGTLYTPQVIAKLEEGASYERAPMSNKIIRPERPPENGNADP